MSRAIDSAYLEQEKSKEKLWSQLLSDKQFYAFEFCRNQVILGTPIDFFCTEVRFGICIEVSYPQLSHRLLTPIIQARLKASGYHIIILSAKEILEAYDQTVTLLDQQFTSLTRFQCG